MAHPGHLHIKVTPWGSRRTYCASFTLVYFVSRFLQYVVDGPDEDVLDYGTVGLKENRTITFKIINKNPVEVRIYFIFVYSSCH